MGYYVQQQATEFFIPKENIPMVTRAIHALADLKNKMSGGLFERKEKTHAWFAWVDMSFVDTSDIQKIFTCWRWEVELDEQGNINGINFTGQKLGDDSTLFHAISEFVRAGSYIEMRGEDDSLWRWLFQKGQMSEQTGRITWE